MTFDLKMPAAGGLVLIVFALLSFDLKSSASVRLFETRRRRAPSTLAQSFAAERAVAQRKRSSVVVSDLFRNNCARCHGADGRGDTPLGHTYNAPDFTDPEWWRKHADITSTASLIRIVTHGKGGMPAFGKKLKRTDIKLLVNYVQRFRKQ